MREARIEHAGNAGVPPPILESCLIDPKVTPELDCKQKWLPAEVEAFRRELFPVLEEVACESPAIAGGLMRQITLTDELRSFIAGVPHQQPSGVDSNVEMRGRIWLAGRFVTLLDKRECEGLSSLPEEDKDQIRALAKSSQLEADKPAGEVLPSPNPPPAVAPETP